MTTRPDITESLPLYQQYHRDMLFGMLMWTMMTCVVISAAATASFWVSPMWTAQIIAVSFGIEAIVCIVSALLARAWRTRLASRLFLSTGSVQVLLFLMLTSDDLYLIGVLGGAVIITVATLVSSSQRIINFWTVEILLLYLVSLVVRQMVPLPVLSFDGAAQWAVMIVPAMILFIIAAAVQAATQHLRGLLERSEAAINDLRKVEADLLTAKEKAEDANAAKNMFLATMSHELRTPLNAILGFTQLLERNDELMTEHHESLRAISQSGDHLLRMINDVLALARIETGQIALQPTHFDLHQLLDDVEMLLQARANEKSIQLHVEDMAKLPRWVYADKGKLRQVLTNIVGNAIKFTDEGGVAVRAEHTEVGPGKLQLCFTVEDTGIGIPTAQLDEVLQPFSQARNNLLGEGTGLGLAISHDFVQAMGGDIEIDSTPGAGTRVSFNVSAYPGKAQHTKPVGQAVGLAEGEPEYRVLVVEDKYNNRMILRRLLEEIGFSVQVAKNGREAVEQVRIWSPDLVWMDVRMPVMDGYEATRLIRALPNGADIKILALTANAHDGERHTILQAGCDDYLAKPYREGELLEKMQQHLELAYVYAVKPPLPEPTRLAAGSAADLPAALRERLTEAAVTANQAACLDVVRQIEGDRPEMAAAMQRCIERFEFEKILDWLRDDTT